MFPGQRRTDERCGRYCREHSTEGKYFIVHASGHRSTIPAEAHVTRVPGNWNCILTAVNIQITEFQTMMITLYQPAESLEISFYFWTYFLYLLDEHARGICLSCLSTLLRSLLEQMIYWLLYIVYYICIMLVAAHRSGLVGHDAWSQIERYSGRRNGLGQDHSNHFAAGPFGMRARELGSASDSRAIVGHAELGNGIQKMVPRLQDSHLLRYAEGAQAEAHWLDQGQCVSRVYYIV